MCTYIRVCNIWEVAFVNDRMISILDNYDMTVLRTWKGRGAILCETEKGVRILKEYTGPKDKLCVLEAVTEKLREAGFLTDCLVRNKEGMLCTEDRDHALYIVKEYREGRECSVSDLSDCVQAVRSLADIHRLLQIPKQDAIRPWKLIPDGTQMQANSVVQENPVQESAAETVEKEELCSEGDTRIYQFRMFMPEQEYERYNKELKRIWKHLREKSAKTDFEVFLLRHYAFFMDQATGVVERMKESGSTDYCLQQAQKGMLCHGDFQHHNILFTSGQMMIVNYEKCMQDIQIRDFYLFFRKIMEKNNWNPAVGDQLLNGYESRRTIDQKEGEQLFLRLSYPEKFRKVVSYYYNSGKSWIPGKNREKLETLLAQEQARQSVLRELERTFSHA